MPEAVAHCKISVPSVMRLLPSLNHEVKWLNPLAQLILLLTLVSCSLARIAHIDAAAMRDHVFKKIVLHGGHSPNLPIRESNYLACAQLVALE